MGVDIAQTRFFDECAGSAGGLAGPMLALGSLTLRETPEILAQYAAANGYARLARELSVSALFADRYGVDRYVSCDINGKADLVLDLGRPLPEDQRGAYLSVLNGGTLEHLFDLRLAMENIHDATAVAGLMIHTCPVTWFNHGFFNINPMLFHLTAEANAYDIAAEGYYFCADTWDGQDRPAVSILGVDRFAPGGEEPLADLFDGRRLPALAMHLIALRKRHDAPFVSPLHVSP
jgi:hypothetical protein